MKARQIGTALQQPVRHGALLDALEEAMRHGSAARRVETLRRITDLFLIGAAQYDQAQIDLFDDVFTCLVQKLEASARALLAERLAPNPAAPPRITHRLAFDDDIAVAAPVLTQSPRLDDEQLINIALSRSQQHLLAIAQRESLGVAVTEVLVDRGDSAVLQTVAENAGSAFSETTFKTMVARADRDDELAIALGQRLDIPRHHLMLLIAGASQKVRSTLAAEFSKSGAAVDSAVQTALNRMHSQSTDSKDVVVAVSLMQDLHDRQLLDEDCVRTFAGEGRFEYVSAALACLSGFDYTESEAVLIDEGTEGLMVMTKVLDFSWSTVKTIFDMRAILLSRPVPDEALARASYERLRPATAQQVLRFHRMQTSGRKAGLADRATA